MDAELHTRTSLLFSQQYLVQVVYNAMLLKHFKDNESELELVILKANQPKSVIFNSDLTQSSLTAFTELGLNQQFICYNISLGFDCFEEKQVISANKIINKYMLKNIFSFPICSLTDVLAKLAYIVFIYSKCSSMDLELDFYSTSLKGLRPNKSSSN